MNVITFVSRNDGAGKSTLAAHLAVAALATGQRCLLIDADPKNALTTWHASPCLTLWRGLADGSD
jgi:chromosome partitioning protein